MHAKYTSHLKNIIDIHHTLVLKRAPAEVLAEFEKEKDFLTRLCCEICSFSSGKTCDTTENTPCSNS